MGEHYTEQDVLAALIYRHTKLWPTHKTYCIGDIRDAIAWQKEELKGEAMKRERFYAFHSNKWVLRKLKFLKKRGAVVDEKFKWRLSDSQFIAQKLLGNLP